MRESCKTHILAMEKRQVYGSTKHYIMIDWKGKLTTLSIGDTTTKLPVFSSQVYYTTGLNCSRKTVSSDSTNGYFLCNPEDVTGDAMCITMDSINAIKETPGRVVGLEHVTGKLLLKHGNSSSHHGNSSSHHGNYGSHHGNSSSHHGNSDHGSSIWKYNPRSNSSEQYWNPCIPSIQTLPITWVTVINNRDVVIATETSRILFVSDGEITSNIRVNHQVHYISVLSDILIRVHHGNSSTDLTIPVLSELTSSSSANQEKASNGCLSSCQKIKMQQLGLLAEERSRCEGKRRFVEEMWRGLFEHTPPQRVDESPFVRQFTKDGTFHVENNAQFQRSLRDSLELEMRQDPDGLSTDCLANLLRLSQS